MKVEVFVLSLLKFKQQDENVKHDDAVFKQSELEEINSSIKSALGSDGKKTSDGWFLYPLKQKHFSMNLKQCCHHERVRITDAQFGYYHHRIILNYVIENVDDFSQLRTIRKNVVEDANTLIYQCLDPKQNKLVEFFYTYPLMIVKEPKQYITRMLRSVEERLHPQKYYQNLLYSKETTSLSFEVVDPVFFNLFGGKRYNIRISIPGTILYTKGKVSKRLIHGIINAIYQYCLYQKKLLDIENKSKYEPSNQLNENLLMQLWEHLLGNLGGKTGESNMSRLTQITVFIGLLAILWPALSNLFLNVPNLIESISSFFQKGE